MPPLIRNRDDGLQSAPDAGSIVRGTGDFSFHPNPNIGPTFLKEIDDAAEREVWLQIGELIRVHADAVRFCTMVKNQAEPLTPEGLLRRDHILGIADQIVRSVFATVAYCQDTFGSSPLRAPSGGADTAMMQVGIAYRRWLQTLPPQSAQTTLSEKPAEESGDDGRNHILSIADYLAELTGKQEAVSAKESSLRLFS